MNYTNYKNKRIERKHFDVSGYPISERLSIKRGMKFTTEPRKALVSRTSLDFSSIKQEKLRVSDQIKEEFKQKLNDSGYKQVYDLETSMLNDSSVVDESDDISNNSGINKDLISRTQSVIGMEQNLTPRKDVHLLETSSGDLSKDCGATSCISGEKYQNYYLTENLFGRIELLERQVAELRSQILILQLKQQSD